MASSENHLCDRNFFARHHLTVARELLGCTLIWDGVGGTIVETEAYGATEDPACHTSFRPSAREFFDRNGPGTVYAYLNYGVHWLLNVLAMDGIILFRAIEPTLGIETIRQRRGGKATQHLCTGPGRLGAALALNESDHGTSFLSGTRHIQNGVSAWSADDILEDNRVGIRKAVDRKWRFLIRNHPHVSIPFGKALTRRR